MNKVMIVDPYPIIGVGLSKILEQHGYQVTSHHANGNNICSALLTEKPDFLIMDPHLPDINGFSLLKNIVGIEKKPYVVIWLDASTRIDPAVYEIPGISAFISKSYEIGDIIYSLEALGQGYTLRSVPSQQKGNGEIKNFDCHFTRRFSAQELTVLKKLCAGKSNKVISLEMDLSNKTISTYKTRILEKMEAKNLMEAIDIARKFERC